MTAVQSPFAIGCGDFRVSYRQDMAIYKNVRVRRRVILLIILFFLFPILAPEYYVSLATMAGIASIGAIGLNILTGFTGQISLGVGAFLGVGGYASALLTTRLGIPFWFALPLSGIFTAGIGALFGIPSLRLKGLYLAMATLAAQVIIYFLFNHWDALTGGTGGLVVQRPSLAGFSLDSEMSYYYLMLVILILTVLFTLNLFRSRVGRALVAVRDRDLAAEVMGIDLFKYKIIAFAVSSFFIGVSGSLMGHYTLVITPENYGTQISIEYLAMILIGGLGSVMGSIYGAAFITLLPVVLRELMTAVREVFPNLESIFIGIKEIIFGGIIIIFLIYESEGLAKMWRNLKDYIKLWPFSY